MKKIIIFTFLIFIGCENSLKTTRDYNYFPGEYRPELNIGDQTSIDMGSSSIKSGDSIIAFISLKDTKNNKISIGGSSIKFFKKNGEGSVFFDNTIDNKDGTYSIKITGEKKGNLSICVVANGKQINSCKELIITQGDISLNKSDIFISRTNFLIGEVADVILFLKDLNNNDLDINGLSLHPTIVGTSQGTVSNFIYSSGKYTSTITANQIGTESELNVSISGIGILKSKYKINVVSTKPNYTKSTISITKSQIKVNESTNLLISIKDINNNILNLENIPITLETYSGTSISTFGDIIKNGLSYVSSIKGIQSGSLTKIRAKVDGEYIQTTGEALIQVVP